MRVVCGDWARVVTPAVTVSNGLTGLLLDPPYTSDEHSVRYAGGAHDVAADVRAWAIEHGDDPLLRIAFCGYDGEHEMPATWTAQRWKAAGGYGSQGTGRGRDNAEREVIWFSPHCLSAPMPALFDEPSFTEVR